VVQGTYLFPNAVTSIDEGLPPMLAAEGSVMPRHRYALGTGIELHPAARDSSSVPLYSGKFRAVVGLQSTISAINCLLQPLGLFPRCQARTC